MRITTSEISMRIWRSFLRAAAQGALVVIPEISHSDISYIVKREDLNTSTSIRGPFFA